MRLGLVPAPWNLPPFAKIPVKRIRRPQTLPPFATTLTGGFSFLAFQLRVEETWGNAFDAF